MEKFDKHIKSKLEERRVVPSEEAWNAIKRELPTHKKSGRFRKYAWGIAASFIGILLITVLFYRQDEKKPAINETVEKRKVEKVLQQESIVVENTESIDKEPNKAKKQPVVIKAELDLSKEEVVNTEMSDKEVAQPLKEIEIGQPLDVIAVKANEVFAQVEKLERISLVEVTDAEVDSLLRVAQEELLSEKIFTENGKVDAMALLTEVEDELDGTLRDQIFDALKDGYLKLRTAVADRNK